MALINCPECNQKVSDKAESCIYCGYPVKENQASKDTKQNKMLKPKDIKEILGCSMSRAYEIINCSDFPKIRIGHRSYISSVAFEKWVKSYTGKEYKIG